jgi:hypothetical protein
VLAEGIVGLALKLISNITYLVIVDFLTAMALANSSAVVAAGSYKVESL